MKILANRIKDWLKDVISSNKTAFRREEYRWEHLLLSQELVKNHHSSKGPAWCIIKVDLKKSYNYVDWYFLLMCLQAAGCPSKYIAWIKECITTPKFSIALNESLVWYFIGKKCLRQGNSAILGILECRISIPSDILIALNCRLLIFSFADYLMIFIEADVHSVRFIKGVVEDFIGLSGLIVNVHKSEVFCVELSLTLKQRILSKLQFKEGSLPVIYLGVPLIFGGPKLSNCKALTEKITCSLNVDILR